MPACSPSTTWTLPGVAGMRKVGCSPSGSRDGRRDAMLRLMSSAAARGSTAITRSMRAMALSAG
jgi:hypothetical protein